MITRLNHIKHIEIEIISRLKHINELKIDALIMIIALHRKIMICDRNFVY